MERLRDRLVELQEQREALERILRPVLRSLHDQEAEFRRRYLEWGRLAAAAEQFHRMGG